MRLLLCPWSTTWPPSIHSPTSPRWAVSPRRRVLGQSSGPSSMHIYAMKLIQCWFLGVCSISMYVPTTCQERRQKSLPLRPCYFGGKIQRKQIISGANKSLEENPSRQVVWEYQGPVCVGTGQGQPLREVRFEQGPKKRRASQFIQNSGQRGDTDNGRESGGSRGSQETR